MSRALPVRRVCRDGGAPNRGTRGAGCAPPARRRRRRRAGPPTRRIRTVGPSTASTPHQDRTRTDISEARLTSPGGRRGATRHHRSPGGRRAPRARTAERPTARHRQGRIPAGISRPARTAARAAPHSSWSYGSRAPGRRVAPSPGGAKRAARCAPGRHRKWPARAEGNSEWRTARTPRPRRR